MPAQDGPAPSEPTSRLLGEHSGQTPDLYSGGKQRKSSSKINHLKYSARVFCIPYTIMGLGFPTMAPEALFLLEATNDTEPHKML